MDEEKSCLNCVHFRQYYFKEQRGFKPIENGICLALTLSKKQLIKFISFGGCEYWQKLDKEQVKASQLKSLKSALIMTIKNIEEILELMKNDSIPLC